MGGGGKEEGKRTLIRRGTVVWIERFWTHDTELASSTSMVTLLVRVVRDTWTTLRLRIVRVLVWIVLLFLCCGSVVLVGLRFLISRVALYGESVEVEVKERTKRRGTRFRMSGEEWEKREGRRRGTYLFSEVHKSIHCLSLTWSVCGLDTLRVKWRKEGEQLIDDELEGVSLSFFAARHHPSTSSVWLLHNELKQAQHHSFGVTHFTPAHSCSSFLLRLLLLDSSRTHRVSPYSYLLAQTIAQYLNPPNSPASLSCLLVSRTSSSLATMPPSTPVKHLSPKKNLLGVPPYLKTLLCLSYRWISPFFTNSTLADNSMSWVNSIEINWLPRWITKDRSSLFGELLKETCTESRALVLNLFRRDRRREVVDSSYGEDEVSLHCRWSARCIMSSVGTWSCAL